MASGCAMFSTTARGPSRRGAIGHVLIGEFFMRWLFCLLLAPLAASAEPVSLTHQARVLDPLGNAVSGTHSVELSFWTVATGGNPSSDRLWAATYPTVPFANGYVSLQLELSDGGDAIESSWFASDVWLQVSVDGSPMLPRDKMTDVPGATAGVVSTASARHSNPAEGQMWFNTLSHELEVFVGTSWQQVVAESPVYKDCASLHAAGRNVTGYYDIDPDGNTGPQLPRSVWCDMTTADGGWTRVFVATTDNYNSTTIPYISGLSGTDSVVSRSSKEALGRTSTCDYSCDTSSEAFSWAVWVLRCPHGKTHRNRFRP